MPRIAGYFTIYFTQPIGQVTTEIRKTVDEFATLAPGATLGYAGKKPAARFVRVTPALDRKLDELLAKAGELDSDDRVMYGRKDGNARDYTSEEFHLEIFGRNLTYIKSHKVTLPNFIQCFFPSNLEGDKLGETIAWFKHIAARFGACYAYLNPVVDYNMFAPASVNSETLAMLKRNLTLDLFDDFNHQRLFIDRVKGPMWITGITSAHTAKLPDLHESESIRISRVGNITYLTLVQNPFEDPVGSYDGYRELARVLSPVTIDTFCPIMFRFPYKYPNNYAKIWLKRFVVDDWKAFAL